MKAKDHVTLARYSLRLARAWATPHTADWLATHEEHILQGTHAEDNFLWPPLVRLGNWHFFRPPDAAEEPRRLITWRDPDLNPAHRTQRLLADLMVLLRAQTHSRKRLLELTARCANSSKPAARAMLTGRILHHIQDMSCPPHAMAVYHAGADCFEAQLPLWLEANKHPLAIHRPDRQQPAETVLALYDHAAQTTRRLVRETPTGPHHSPHSLEIYWKAPPAADPDPRNGRYGPCDRDQFGARWVEVPGEGVTMLIEAPATTTDNICSLFAHKAINEGAEALLLAGSGC